MVARVKGRLPFLITFSREGKDDEVRLAWSGEEALRVGKSILNQRAELLPGDALRVQWNGADLTTHEPRTS
jgi:hypothetical protein